MSIVEEETDETLFWLAMLIDLNDLNQELLERKIIENSQFIALIVTSIKTAKRNLKWESKIIIRNPNSAI